MFAEVENELQFEELLVPSLPNKEELKEVPATNQAQRTQPKAKTEPNPGESMPKTTRKEEKPVIVPKEPDKPQDPSISKPIEQVQAAPADAEQPNGGEGHSPSSE